MEKQANKLNNFLVLYKSIQFIIAFLIFGSFFQSKAQTRVPFDQGKRYILADVKVTGKVSYNQQTIVSFAGLEKGQEITVPGDEISTALKKLGKLGLFSDINFYTNKIVGDSIFIELNIDELPKLNSVKIVGVKKSKTEDLIKDNDLKKGKIVNENLITTAKNYIDNKYKKNGFYNTKTTINIVPDSIENQVNMVVNVDTGKKIKISAINFEGNKMFSKTKLHKQMKNTKEQFIFRVLKASKFIKKEYTEDLENIISGYKEKGYRDARILSDTVIFDRNKNKLSINIKIEEGNKYYFGDIKFLGNTIYSDQGLRNALGIAKGDVYNGVLLEKRIADKTSPDADDITNLYQNNGYLFSSINAVETKTANDTINFEIRVLEGPLAYFNKISVVGNDKTNDRVIYRELKTKPGMVYSKDLVVRSVREIGTMGFFDAEAIDPKFKNVDAAAGTVDIEYNVVEKGSSQIELQGGYGGGGFIGTLGLSFNNFSARNMFKKDAYNPIPMGDGQKVSLRLQGSIFFQTYSASFSEPWFGGKKPVRFNSSLSYSKQFLNDQRTGQVDKERSFNIISLSVGIDKQLKVPDDSFILSQAISFQYYDLNNYNTGLFTFGNGSSRNFAYNIAISRNNKGNNPIFPTYGSEFSLSAKFTPPYSLLNGVDYGNLGNKIENKLQYTPGQQNLFSTTGPNGELIQAGDYISSKVLEINGVPTRFYSKVLNPQDADADQSKVDQEKFRYLEYFKIKFKADWFTPLPFKLVLRSVAEFGFLGNYNPARGNVPFERFFVGGDGLQNFALDGREVIQLRGYPNQSLTPFDANGNQNGATIYNKFSFELRYPITLKQSASIYALTFFEAGAGFDETKVFNPFVLQRSAGFGLRIFMPAFGLLGIDFGHGFDAINPGGQKNGWETHFIIGQQF